MAWKSWPESRSATSMPRHPAIYILVRLMCLTEGIVQSHAPRKFGILEIQFELTPAKESTVGAQMSALLPKPMVSVGRNGRVVCPRPRLSHAQQRRLSYAAYTRLKDCVLAMCRLAVALTAIRGPTCLRMSRWRCRHLELDTSK